MCTIYLSLAKPGKAMPGPYNSLMVLRLTISTLTSLSPSNENRKRQTTTLPHYSTTTRTPKPFPSQRLTTPSATARRTRTITRTGTSSSTGTDDTNRPRAPVGRLLAFEAATLEAEPRLGAETAAARITPVPVCPLALRAALALCGQAGSVRTLQTGRLPPFHAAPASSSSAPLSVAEALTATRWPDAPMRSALHALCLTASRRRRRAPRVPAAPAAAATT